MKSQYLNLYRGPLGTFFGSRAPELGCISSRPSASSSKGTEKHPFDRIPRQRPPDVTGIILAGGRSSRFGSNKALADFEGVPLIERVLGVLGGLFDKTIIITNSPEEYRYLGITLHEDIIKGLGPLGGIYSALSAMTTPWGFVAACDMPFLNPQLITHMLSLRAGFEAVVPRMDWKIEPLHALYGSGCLEPVKRMVSSGSYQIIQLFRSVKVRYVEAHEIGLFDCDFKSFININRPIEMQSFSGHVKRCP